ncbi:MAG TPA: serine protease [Pseudolabrys sp.]|nr:serine protease [Pseudolabrys sp.]
MIAAAAVAACATAHADNTVVRSLPLVFQLYKDKVERLRSSEVPRTFTGTASVSPNGALPQSVSIGIRGIPPQFGHFCGGTIVAPHWILTAAHCIGTAQWTNGKATIAVLDPDQLQILSGTKVLFHGGRVTAVVRIVTHPERRLIVPGVPENDLALLQVAEPFTEPPLAIVTETQAATLLVPREKLGIVGWGTASFSADAAISNTLLFAYVDVVDRPTCNKIYDGLVTDKMFCAGIGVADACQGDSGGPAISYIDDRPVLVGITSWGAGCAQKQYPGVYVNVAKYRAWIEETIGAPRS